MLCTTSLGYDTPVVDAMSDSQHMLHTFIIDKHVKMNGGLILVLLLVEVPLRDFVRSISRKLRHLRDIL